MIDLCKDSSKLCQMIILPMVDKPKEELIQFFGCLKYKFNQACPLKKQSDSLNIPTVVKHNHQKWISSNVNISRILFLIVVFCWM